MITNEELDACHQLGLIVRRQLPVFRIGQIVRGEFGKVVFWKRFESNGNKRICFTFEFTPPILDFLAQQILLVQEQNHRDRLEPAIVPNRVEQFKRLAQPILGVVLAQRHIVRACCHH